MLFVFNARIHVKHGVRSDGFSLKKFSERALFFQDPAGSQVSGYTDPNYLIEIDQLVNCLSHVARATKNKGK